MFAPMLLGYAVGAIGVYALLYRFAPVRAENLANAAASTPTEVYTLFEADEPLRHAA